MKICITGATGYIGHELALKLAGQNHIVSVLVRDTSSPNVPAHKNIQVSKGDITDRSTFGRAIEGCDVIFHTAALVKLYAKDPADFYNINVEGTRNMLLEAVSNNVKKFVFTSTCGMLGESHSSPISETDPNYNLIDNDYDYSKFLAGNLVKEFHYKNGLNTVIVSLPKIYGPGLETHPVSVNRIINNFVKGRPTFIPRPAGLISNYSFINDVVEGHILAMEKGVGGETYILSGENISYSKLFEMLRSLSGSKAVLIPVPSFIIKGVARLQWLQGKISRKDPFFTTKAVRHIFCNKAFSNEKAVRELSYQPTSILSGLQQTIAYLKNSNPDL